MATADSYLDMNNGKKKKKKKSKKKEEEIEDDFDETPSVLVSRNAEMPEGVELSDGDDDDDNDGGHDDPHKALGAINLDDLTSAVQDLRKSPPRDRAEPVEFFGQAKKAAEKKKEKKEKKAKKEKKPKKEKKAKKAKESSPQPEENGKKDDLDFWLSPSNNEAPTTAVEKSKKKHKKKTSKETELSPKVNGIVSATSPLALNVLASNSALKLSYDMRRVPMDPDKLTAGISFCNQGSDAISSIEMDFVDTGSIQMVRENPEKGLKLEMDLSPGKVEDHLFLFKVH